MWLFLHLLSQYGYLALFFLVMIGGTYVPIPSGIILVAVGALSHHHQFFRLTLSFIVALAGSLADDTLTYSVTRWIGQKERYQRFVDRTPYASFIEKEFSKRPTLVVAASRFIGITGMPVNALAGLTRMPLIKFLPAAALGDGICIAVYLAIGFTLGTPFAHDLKTALSVVTWIIVIGTILSLGFFFISKVGKSSLNSIESS